ncbi:OmpA family protein [Caulobacter zeae]|nr:OmpA family protein [Caulobacter zeae]
MIAFLLAVALQAAPSAPPPPPSPPSPPPGPHTDEVIVYHPSGSTGTRAVSEHAIDAAVQQIRFYKPAKVIVQSHTDTVGSSDSNMALSTGRAEAVRRALVEAGVDAQLIELQPMGETAPAVKTADDVAEPVNNRTVVILRQITLPKG